jgi:hypothetical protein
MNRSTTHKLRTGTMERQKLPTGSVEALRAAGICGLLVLVTVSVGYIGARSRSRTLTALRTTLRRISGR